MKYTTTSVIALAGLSNALPQFSIPAGFSIPSFSIPTFSLGGLGGATGLPSFGGSALPTSLSGLGTGSLSGLGGGSLTGLPALTVASATEAPQASVTGIVTQASSTEAASSGSVGSDCTPQSSSGGDTENGVADKNCCTALTIVFARGTTESGNVGTVAGPPFFKSLRSKLGDGKVTIQGVDYPADVAGNANLGASGGPAMASSVKAALSQCPSTKVVVSGYSQGGLVVHNAFSSQGLSSTQVTGAVVFGDPEKNMAIGNLPSSKVKEFCASGDAVCEDGTGVITAAHLTYGDDADAAAEAAMQFAGLS